MKKNIILTTVLGFIVGLILSGVIFDIITVIGKSFTRISVAITIAKAEKAYSQERFSDSVFYYNKALPKINPESTKLLAKTENNLALSIIKKEEKSKNLQELKNAQNLLDHAYQLYVELNDGNSAEQTKKNSAILTEILSQKNQ